MASATGSDQQLSNPKTKRHVPPGVSRNHETSFLSAAATLRSATTTQPLLTLLSLLVSGTGSQASRLLDQRASSQAWKASPAIA